MKYIFRVAAILLAAAFLTSQSALAQMMGHAPPVPMSPRQFAQAVVGQPVQIAVRITGLRRTALFGELLQHESDAIARATGKRVTLYFAQGTPVIMGKARDIVPGAVLFVYGVLTKPGNVDVKQAVVDTRFVRVR